MRINEWGFLPREGRKAELGGGELGWNKGMWDGGRGWGFAKG